MTDVTPAQALSILKQVCDSVSANWETHQKIQAALRMARDCILKTLREEQKDGDIVVQHHSA